MKPAFRVTALVRKAVGPKDAAAGMQIFRAKAFRIAEGQSLVDSVDAFYNGYSGRDFLRSVACVRAVLLEFTRMGMAVKLPGIGTLSPVIKGKILPGQKDWRKSIQLAYKLRIEKSYERELLKGLDCAFENMTPAMPNPTLLEAGYLQDAARTDFYLNQGVILRGTRMKYNEDNPDEGIFFSARGCPTVRAEVGFQQDKRMLLQIPRTLVPNRNYTVRVRAKLYRCTDVREGFLEQKVMIRAE